MIDATQLLTNPDSGTFCREAAEYVNGKRFHVTGGGGTIGRAVCALLVEYGAADVAGIDRDEGRLATIPSGCYRVLADVSRRYPRLSKPDTIIHCAAYKHVDGLEFAPSEAMTNNVTATQNVAEWCRDMGARMVYLSTDKAISPVGVLGLTKALGEHVARSIANANVVRLVNVIGSSGSVIERWCDEWGRGEPISICNPGHLRHYVSERNAANTVLSALLAPDRTDLIPAEYETISTGTLADRFVAMHPGCEWRITDDRPGERHTEPVIPAGDDTIGRYGIAEATGKPIPAQVQEVG